MCVCVCVYPVRDPETMHRNTSVSEYSIPIINPEWSPKRNSKPWLILLG